MCTVSYVPAGKTVYLTSNRDERTTRGKALLPRQFALAAGQQIIYPTDSEAGGTWIGLKNNGDAAVLLNGAFVAHRSGSTYRKSRGLVVLEIVEAAKPLDGFRAIDLYGIEPFTLVLFTAHRLFECRWDGAEKFETELNAAKPHIWSSATLYDNAAQRLRRAWFETFIGGHTQPTEADIMHFHRTGGIGDNSIDLVMNRSGAVKTVSITSLCLKPRSASLTYLDLDSGLQATKGFAQVAASSAEKEVAYA